MQESLIWGKEISQEDCWFLWLHFPQIQTREVEQWRLNILLWQVWRRRHLAFRTRPRTDETSHGPPREREPNSFSFNNFAAVVIYFYRWMRRRVPLKQFFRHVNRESISLFYFILFFNFRSRSRFARRFVFIGLCRNYVNCFIYHFFVLFSFLSLWNHYHESLVLFCLGKQLGARFWMLRSPNLFPCFWIKGIFFFI